MFEILYHTIRGTIRAYLSIPFYIVGWILYFPAIFFGSIGEKLSNEGRISFNPVKVYKIVKENMKK